MKLRHLSLSLIALLACGAASAAEHEGKAPEKAGAVAVEQAIAIGTVTALDADKKSFTLKEEKAGKAAEYRALYSSPDLQKLLDQISKLKVGDQLKVTYTEHEGRRAMVIEGPKKK